ncbi:hypothetical protein STCU_00235 [Strigomonas culicis]|uniref:Uncharacterized protein n=1 Tax=Strigomonas culicis TaxID=28005 RepID=S9V1W9_9TRYP|nr:hypothetical protein STCU_00235 [Strigomonas culicis]|eukprot:EPY37062.1 hypothetical protein STCU_00235 [Strigomonas culicis]
MATTARQLVQVLETEPRRAASVYATSATSATSMDAVSEEERNALFTALARRDGAAEAARLVQQSRHKSALVNAVSPAAVDFGRTPLHVLVLAFPARSAAGDATAAARVELLQLLLESGANVNAADRLEETPFAMAVADGKTRVVEELLATAGKVRRFGNAGSQRQRTAVPDLRRLNRNGENVLFAACERGDAALLQQLLAFAHLVEDTAGAEVTPPPPLLSALLNQLNHSRETPLVHLVRHGGDAAGHVEVVRLLLAENHRPVRGPSGDNAARRPTMECVTALDLAITDAEGNDALTLARRYELRRIAALLEAEKASQPDF